MRKIPSLTLVVFMVTAACYAQRLVAQDNYLDTKKGPTVFIGTDAKTTDAKDQGQTNGNACELSQCCGQDSCDNGCSDFPLACSCCPTVSVAAGFGIDSFHGVGDLLSNNFGAVTGVNSGMPVPRLRDYGIGWQLGMSYGIYDWDGRTTSSKYVSTQQQTFVTTGFFHKAQEGQRLSYGVVYDWMFNENWGGYVTAPTLGQWRGQVEYAVSNRNAFGLYGAFRDKGSMFSTSSYPYYDLHVNGINQVDLFWHHKFDMGADSRLWFGLPDRDHYASYDLDANRSGTLLDWIIGAQIEVPLSENLALVAAGQYGHPTSSAGAVATAEQYYDISAGVIWYIGGHAKKASINGDCWQPYMPVANNSTFLVKQRASSPY